VPFVLTGRTNPQRPEKDWASRVEFGRRALFFLVWASEIPAGVCHAGERTGRPSPAC